MKRLEKEFNMQFGNRIGIDKKSPKARQYQKPLLYGKSDWETALLDFQTAITKDGKTVNSTGTDFIIHFCPTVSTI